MSNSEMNPDQFNQLINRIDGLEKRMITKSDVFQSVLTVQAFFAATIVGSVVVLNALGKFG